MVKNRYPLTLMNTVFELLQQARWFTKLDLWNVVPFKLNHVHEILKRALDFMHSFIYTDR